MQPGCFRVLAHQSSVVGRELLDRPLARRLQFFHSGSLGAYFNMEAAWPRLSDGSLSGQRSPSSPSSSWPLFWHSSGDDD